MCPMEWSTVGLCFIELIFMRSSLACFNFSVSDLIYRLDFSIGSSLELILARPLLGCTNARSLIFRHTGIYSRSGSTLSLIRPTFNGCLT